MAAPGHIDAPRPSRAKKWKKRALAAFLLFFVLPLVLHVVLVLATRITPHPISMSAISGDAKEARPGLRVFGSSYARKRGGILEVRLAGTAEEIGYRHARLLYPEMVENEGTLYGQFQHYVPIPPLRWLIMDLSRLEFRHVDEGMTEGRRREIAAQSLGFSPDPYDGVLPTYHRFVFLHSLYDIALSFEHSPLLGCTSFVLGDGAFENGHVVLARNFDFEAGPVFDLGKAVFLVREEGRIPYASVSWPGLIGAVSGMNAEGLALVVHGARARKPRAKGEPVVHTTRDLLGRARTIEEALDLLKDREPMVSHMIFLVDAKGDTAIVERAPGEPIFVRLGRGKVALTNHLEGPLSADPANQRVEATTSTRPRKMRLDELLENLPQGASVERVVGVLRDKKGVGGVDLPIGHRRTIDALIATHAVVMDVSARSLWVSEGPHLLGRFLRFDLARLLSSDYEPGEGEPLEVLPEDPLLRSKAYEEWQKAGAPHHGEN